MAFKLIEYFTEALVLDKRDLGEADALVYLYTEELGKVVAKAKSAKRMVSKLSPHLEPLHFVKTRLVSGKNGNFQAVDTLSFKKTCRKNIKNNSENMAKFARIADFIKETTFELHPDKNLWQLIEKIFSSQVDEHDAYKKILKELGFDPNYAECGVCSVGDIRFFHHLDQIFLCDNCAPQYFLNDVAPARFIRLKPFNL